MMNVGCGIQSYCGSECPDGLTTLQNGCILVVGGQFAPDCVEPEENPRARR